MTSCDPCRELLIDYYYRELPAQQRDEVTRHLTTCSGCAVEYCRLQADLSGVGEALERAPRPRVQARLRQRVAQEFAPPTWQRVARWLVLPVPAYQTVLLVAALLLLWALLGPARPGAGPGGRPPEATASQHTTLFEQYDASHILHVDPNLL